MAGKAALVVVFALLILIVGAPAFGGVGPIELILWTVATSAAIAFVIWRSR